MEDSSRSRGAWCVETVDDVEAWTCGRCRYRGPKNRYAAFPSAVGTRTASAYDCTTHVFGLTRRVNPEPEPHTARARARTHCAAHDTVTHSAHCGCGLRLLLHSALCAVRRAALWRVAHTSTTCVTPVPAVCYSAPFFVVEPPGPGPGRPLPLCSCCCVLRFFRACAYMYM